MTCGGNKHEEAFALLRKSEVCFASYASRGMCACFWSFEMRQFLKTLNEFSLQKPDAAAFLGPWFFVALPLVFTPDGIWDWASVKHFMDVMSGWAPMIDRFSKYAASPERMRFVLACAWASGPLVMLFACVVGYRAFAHGTQKRRESKYWAIPLAILFLGGLLYLFSHGAVNLRSRGIKVMLFAFANGYGFTVLGWLMITSLFSISGLLFAGTVIWIKQDLS